jgi:hypothetical protein
MQKLEIIISDFYFKFYAIRIDGEKIREHEDVVKLFGGWNPAFCSEHDITLYIRDNPELFEDYEINYVYIDIQ